MGFFLYLCGFLVLLASYALFWAFQVNKYWENRGVPHAKPLLFLGNYLDLILQRRAGGEIIYDISKRFPREPLFGVFQFITPMLIVRDQELIERVLVKDFQHFTDHGFYVDDDTHPFDANVFNMAGQKWRAMRKKLSPMFTSGKLKAMSSQMTEIGERMIQKLDSSTSESSNEFELKDIFERLTMDIIGTCGFGINPGALEGSKSEFREIASKVFEMNVFVFVKIIFMLKFPNMAKRLGISLSNPDVIEYFKKILEETMARRSQSDVNRNDFIQLMLTLKEKGFIEITSKDSTDDYLKLDAAHEDSSGKEIFELTAEKIVGQSLIFLSSGFKTSSNAMVYFCYDLSNHLDIQERLRKEIKEVVEANSGNITYETVKNTPYLDMCLKESMRMHPVAQAINRICTKEYTFPGTNVTIRPGEQLIIPTLIVHMDPEIYPKPNEYIPERFSRENDAQASCSFLAFGDGPRICIAMRFALTEIKIAMVHLLLRYRIKLSPKTKPLRTNTRTLIAEPQDKVIFTLERI